MKKFFAFLLCLTMLLGAANASTLEGPAADMRTMTADEFYSKYEGKGIAFDGCVEKYNVGRKKLTLHPGDYGDDHEGMILFSIALDSDGNYREYEELKPGDNVRVTATICAKKKSLVEKATLICLGSARIVGRPTETVPYIDSLILKESGYSDERAEYTIKALQDGTKDRDAIKLNPDAVKAQYEEYAAKYDEPSKDDPDSNAGDADSEEDATAYETLEKGSKGDSVKALQQRLIDLFYLDDKADGSFGNKTKAAVEDFQKACGIDVTGVADPETQTALYADDAPKSSPNISCSSIVIGSNAKSTWYVDGQEFTLTGNKTKTVKTRWGTYKFDAFGNFEKIN